MFPTMILTGIAFALTYGPLTIAATDGIAEEEQGVASGILSTAIQFGAALGLSVVSAVSVIYTGTDGSPQAVLNGFRAALTVPVAGAILAAVITATGFRRQARTTTR